jgi:hypothetical protein
MARCLRLCVGQGTTEFGDADRFTRMVSLLAIEGVLL